MLGPCFEQTARYWARHLASAEEVGGLPDHVGPTTVTLADGTKRQLDVVVASGDAAVASERRVLAIGEAKAGEELSARHLTRLEEAREALGERAAGAKLLLFGGRFTRALTSAARRRGDIELVGWERLYG